MKNALAVRKENAVGQETLFGGNNYLTNRCLTNYRSAKERGRDRRAGNRERASTRVKFFPRDGFQSFTIGVLVANFVVSAARLFAPRNIFIV